MCGPRCTINNNKLLVTIFPEIQTSKFADKTMMNSWRHLALKQKTVIHYFISIHIEG